MAVTTEQSTEYALTQAVPAKVPASHQLHGRMRIAFFAFTQGSSAGDATSTATLVKLPAGKVRLMNRLSYIGFSALGASRTLDLGWQAYTDDNGDAVAADPNGLDDGVDVSSAGSVIPGGTIGTHETKLFESQAGVVIDAQINDGTIPAAATLMGHLVYVVD